MPKTGTGKILDTKARGCTAAAGSGD